MTVKRRILCIDGGGIKGVFPASFLACLEEATGSQIADHFDLIAGTSTGGIIALGLGLGLRAADILSIYEKHGPAIFARPAPKGKANYLLSKLVPEVVRRRVQVKYGAAPLLAVLTETFGARLLGESKTRLVIPAYHAAQRDVYVFKTAHHPRLEIDFKCRVVDVAMSTAAAPTYFPAHKMLGGLALIDGGVWANNPAGLAVVEAIGILGWPRDELYVLSIGCTEPTYCIPHETSELQLASGVSEIFLQGQSKGALGTAKLLIGDTPQRRRLFRYQTVVPHGLFELDGIEHVSTLKGLGAAEARIALPEVREIFLGPTAETFVPYRGTKDQVTAA
jgi:hypothetical protein